MDSAMSGPCVILLVDALRAVPRVPMSDQPTGGRLRVVKLYSVRSALPEDQRELTRLRVRATMRAGYDDAFIDRAMPALTMTIPLISGGCVQLAQDTLGEIVGVVAATTTTLQGIALLYAIFVDPAHWKSGIGRLLFGAAVDRARQLKAGAMMIHAAPSAEGFYKKMGAIRIGEGPFVYSPEIMLPHFLYLIPRDA
jgi:GNAT superfamily N-acetyltransferase